jgi:hypothetical protein
VVARRRMCAIARAATAGPCREFHPTPNARQPPSYAAGAVRYLTNSSPDGARWNHRGRRLPPARGGFASLRAIRRMGAPGLNSWQAFRTRIRVAPVRSEGDWR